MGDENVIAFDAYGVGGITTQFVQQCGLEALSRNPQMLEFVRLHEPPRPVVLEDKPVAAHYLSPGSVLRKIEVVFDDFENHVVTGKSKNEHHHSACALGNGEAIARLL